MHRHKKTLLSLLCLLVAVPAGADWVYLKNGNRLRGSAQTLANGDVAITTAGGTMQVPAKMVHRVEGGASLEALAEEELGTLARNDAEGRFDLALRLEAAGASTLARRVLGEVVRIDPDHDEARRRLGQVDCDGRWLTEVECHERRGEVYYRGRWIASSEWARIEALEVQRRAADLERLRQEARLDALQARSAQAPSVYGPYYQPYYWGGGVVVAPRPKAPTTPAPPVTTPNVPAPGPAPMPSRGGSNRSTFRAPERAFVSGSAASLQR